MSNRVVSATFRHIIDDVIANVRQDFEDMGIEKEVLEELQRSWEAKLVATQVTEFDGAGAHAQRSGGAQTYPGAPASSTHTEHGTLAKTENGADGSAVGEDDFGTGQKRKREAHDDDDTRDLAKPRHESDKSTHEHVSDAQKDEIGSDLDDSDDDDGDGSEDMILCLYDKVQRVKNKWKCVLRDGVASIGGRDYLFSKCNGYVRAEWLTRSEFEW